MKKSIKQYLVIFGLLMLGFTIGQCTKPCLQEKAKMVRMKAKFDALEDDYWEAINEKSNCDQTWMRILDRYKQIISYYEVHCD